VRVAGEPGEHRQRAPVGEGQHHPAVVAAHGRDSLGGGIAGDGAQDEGGELGVAQGVDHERGAGVVGEPAEHRVVPAADRVGIDPRCVQAEHHVRRAIGHLGQDVEQPGPAGEQHLHLAHDDRGVAAHPRWASQAPTSLPSDSWRVALRSSMVVIPPLSGSGACSTSSNHR